MKVSFSRPLQLTVAALASMVVVVFLLLGGLTLASERRVRTAIEGAERLDAYGQTCRVLEQAAVAPEQAPSGQSRGDLVEVAAKSLRKLALDAQTSGSPSGPLLMSARERLMHPRPASNADIQEALRDCSGAVVLAQSDHVLRMGEMRGDLDQELSIAFIAPILMLGLMAAVVLYARTRVFEPLRALGVLVSRLSEGQLKPAAVGNADPAVLPLYENYNRLVSRLQELEAANRTHTESLSKEVQQAARALLEQQQSLARAETLAAVGEVAASVAHELRNPIAGIQMALSNLQSEVDDEDVRERLALVSEEVTRLGRTLEGMLAQSKHTPEASRTLRLAETVEQLVVLSSYQMPPGVKLSSEIAEGLTVRLPEDRFRQAVLNLVLNAAQAMTEGGGTIVVEAELAAGNLRVAVTDDGPGFPQALLDSGGLAFSTSRPEGTGLGLAIVQRFVRDLEGKLELENLSPRGARALMVLPLRDTHA